MLYIIFLSQLLLKWHGVVVFGLTLDRGKKKKSNSYYICHNYQFATSQNKNYVLKCIKNVGLFL